MRSILHVLPEAPFAFDWDSGPPVSAKHAREVRRHIALRSGSFSLGNPLRLLVGQVVPASLGNDDGPGGVKARLD